MEKPKAAAIAVAAIIGLVLVMAYPVAFLLVGIAGWAWWSRRDARAPLTVLAVAACCAVVFYCLAALPTAAKAALSGQPRPAPGIAGWFTTDPLPVQDSAARIGLLLGAVAGVVLSSLRFGGRIHDEKHVHGLKVASSAAKGTSRWAGDKDIAHVAEFGPPKEGPFGGGTVVGKLNGRIVRLVPEKGQVQRPAVRLPFMKEKGQPPLPQHACVVAGTGGGKSYSFVVPNIVAAAMTGESLVITDPKGELACTLGPWLRQKGYKVYLFNLAYPQWSMCWNPVLEARDDEEITAFATAVVQNAAKDKSGYFVMKEIQLLKALVYLLRADFPPEQAHLRAALSLISWPVEALDERFEQAYREGRLPQEGYEEWRGAVSSNYDNAVSGLSAKLNVVRSEPVARLLSRHEIDLSALGREKAALFCVLPIRSGHLKPILAAFYYFFFKRLEQLAAEHGGKLLNPTRFLLDEFANVGEIPGFTETISTARSMGVRIQFVLQGLKQLQDVYGAAEAETILSNCPIQLFLGGDDLTTTRYFSSRLGVTAVYAESERKDVTMPWQRATEIPKRTESVVRRPLMEPEELSRMAPLAAVCLVRWCLPMYLEKLDWKELPQAQEVKALAAKSLAELCPARPDFRVELPPIPEAPDEKKTPKRERSERGRAAEAEPKPEQEVREQLAQEGQDLEGEGDCGRDDLFTDLGI